MLRKHMPNLYDFVRPFSRIAFRLYYRDISIHGLEKIPLHKPVIITTNHPTAFIEPCILAAFLPRKLHYLARGDIFVKDFYSRILRSLNIIPIYRFRDGFGKMKQNEASFSEAIKLLGEDKGALHILVEGTTRQMKHLNPLQKGAARIAFQTLRLFPEEELEIVPIGLTYGNPNRVRDIAMISVGDPIAVREYLPEGEGEERQALKELTEEIHRRLKKEMVHIEPKENEAFYELVLNMDRSSNYRNVMCGFRHTRIPLNGQQYVASEVAAVPELGWDVFQAEVKFYYEYLQKMRVTDLAVTYPHYLNIRTGFFLIFMAPLFLLSCLINIWPILLADRITSKRVREKEFVASVRLGLYTLLFMIYLPLLALLCVLLLGWKGLLIPLFAILSAPLALFYRDQLNRFRQVLRFRMIHEDDRHDLTVIRKQIWAWIP